MNINDVAEISTDYQELLELRKNGILLNPIGTLPKYSQQNANFGLPIAIMNYQHSLVQEFRRSKLEQTNLEESRVSLWKCRYMPDSSLGGDKNPYELVYRDLTINYGYFVQQGGKFGCDFVLYEKDPQECHSSFLVNIFSPNTQESILSVKDILLFQRVSNQVRKKAVLALVEYHSSNSENPIIRYITLGSASCCSRIIK